jgi:hypothetical protein
MRRRVQTAYHEAGHAAAVHLLGHRIKLVSIRPAGTMLGFCDWHVPAVSDGDLSKIGYVPIFQLPARLRRIIETKIAVVLCGPIAAELTPTSSDYGYDRSDGEEAERLANSLVGLTIRERVRLAEVEAADAGDPDEERARGLAWGIAGEEAMRELALMRATARRIVYTEPVPTLIRSLAAVLLDKDVVSGREAHQVFKAIEAEHSAAEARRDTKERVE